MRNLYAVLIGINHYHDPRYELQGCVNDMLAMKQFLETYYDNEAIKPHIICLENDEAKRKDVIKAFEHYSSLQDGDLAFFYFSGHGSRMKAPDLFKHEESDGMLRSIVCHDSRARGGSDLYNKELSYLIWKAVNEKEVHFTAIMDCCFAGSNTRLSHGVKARMRAPKGNAILVENFIGYEHFNQSVTRELKAPVGRHIALAACKRNETAKELFHEGKVRGAFTYSLLKALNQEGRNIPYSELIKSTNIQVRQLLRNQSPQIDFIDANDSHAIFLDGICENGKKKYKVYYDPTYPAWLIDAGSVHGMVQGDEKFRTEFKLIDTDESISIVKVGLTKSEVSGMKEKPTSEIFQAELIQLAVEKLKVAFTAKCNPEDIEKVRQELANRPSDLFELVEERDAKYLLHVMDNEYGISYKNNQRFLFNNQMPFNQESLVDLINKTQKIAKWENLRGLNHGESNLKEDKHFQVELEMVLGANDPKNEEGMPVDANQPIHLPYTYDGNDWQKPALRFKITNLSGGPFWFSVLYLGDRYEVIPMQKGIEVQGKDSTWITVGIGHIKDKTFQVQLEDDYLEHGLTGIREYLKLMVSTEELDTSDLQQAPFPWEGYLKKFRSLETRYAFDHADWNTKTIELNIRRPIELVRFGLSSVGVRVEAPVGVQGEMGLLRFEDLMSAYDRKAYLVGNQAGMEFNPVEVIEGLRDIEGVSVISLYVEEGEDRINKENPLTIYFQEINEVKPVPYSFDPNNSNFEVLEHHWDGHRLSIHTLPSEMTSIYKGLGRARHLFLGEGVEVIID